MSRGATRAVYVTKTGKWMERQTRSKNKNYAKKSGWKKKKIFLDFLVLGKIDP